MGKLSPLNDAFGNTDLIMVISPLVLGHYTISEVYVRSNRIINEPKRIRTARVTISFFRPESGKLVSEFTTCLDPKKENPDPRFDFHNATSKTGKFIAQLFTKAFNQIEKGEKEGCN